MFVVSHSADARTTDATLSNKAGRGPSWLWYGAVFGSSCKNGAHADVRRAFLSSFPVLPRIKSSFRAIKAIKSANYHAVTSAPPLSPSLSVCLVTLRSSSEAEPHSVVIPNLKCRRLEITRPFRPYLLFYYSAHFPKILKELFWNSRRLVSPSSGQARTYNLY